MKINALYEFAYIYVRIVISMYFFTYAVNADMVSYFMGLFLMLDTGIWTVQRIVNHIEKYSEPEIKR